MTIEKEPPGVWFVTCDQCQYRLELDTDPDDEFREAAKDARLAGWPSTQLGRTEWFNFCPDCRHDLREKTLRDAGIL